MRRRSQLQATARWIRPPSFATTTRATNSSFADLNWWQVYQDDALQALIREAFTNNYDLRIAVTRVEQARAVAMQARSQFVPNVKYNGAVSQRTERFVRLGLPEQRRNRQFGRGHTQRVLGSGSVGPRPPPQRVGPRPVSGLGGSPPRRPVELC